MGRNCCYVSPTAHKQRPDDRFDARTVTILDKAGRLATLHKWRERK
jgi:hypothetical protein